MDFLWHLYTILPTIHFPERLHMTIKSIIAACLFISLAPFSYANMQTSTASNNGMSMTMIEGHLALTANSKDPNFPPLMQQLTDDINRTPVGQSVPASFQGKSYTTKILETYKNQANETCKKARLSATGQTKTELVNVCHQADDSYQVTYQAESPYKPTQADGHPAVSANSNSPNFPPFMQQLTDAVNHTPVGQTTSSNYQSQEMSIQVLQTVQNAQNEPCKKAKLTMLGGGVSHVYALSVCQQPDDSYQTTYYPS